MLKQSQKKLKSRRRLSRSGLQETPSASGPGGFVRRNEGEDNWYKEMDVSASSTGSDIRDRLQASLKLYPTKPEEGFVALDREMMQFSCEPAPRVFDDVSPIGYFGESDVNVVPVQYAEPAWVSRNPHLATLFDPSVVTSQLPPLFRTPISSGSSSPLVNWTIPDPVLFGLGRTRRC